jgi:hypothetical protein
VDFSNGYENGLPGRVFGHNGLQRSGAPVGVVGSALGRNPTRYISSAEDLMSRPSMEMTGSSGSPSPRGEWEKEKHMRAMTERAALREDARKVARLGRDGQRGRSGTVFDSSGK